MRHTGICVMGGVLGALVFLNASACSKHTDATGSATAAASASANEPAGAASGAAASDGTSTAPGTGTSFGTGFEGAITMHTTGTHGVTEILFLTKGGKLRVDVPGHDGQLAHGIIDPAAKTIVVLMDSQKLAMQMPIPTPGATSAVATASKTGKVTRTGKHETVAGYDCEDWEITHETGKRESACVAEGLSFFDLSTMAGTVGGVSPSWVDELRERGGFPLRTIETDPAGKEISRMEVTKIEKKPIDAANFTVPAAYHLMQMPGIPGMAGMPHPSRPTH
jgi:hypothetical protein